MRPHEKLDVWKKAVDFVVTIYKNTKNFPTEEKYGLTSQIRRAAISIPANIAEGSARQTTKDFLNFLSMAQGSSSELETELLIAQKLGYITEENYIELKNEAEVIGRMLIGLSKHLRQKL